MQLKDALKKIGLILLSEHNQSVKDAQEKGFRRGKAKGMQEGYSEGFKEAQGDEAMRLAYVALTRAEKQCYWFVEKKDGGAANIVDQEDDIKKYWKPG